MKTYVAIGHFKGDENTTSIALTQCTKKAFLHDCYSNEFVPYVVITEPMFDRIKSAQTNWDTYEIVKKMTTNYRVWNKVTDYLEQCLDIIDKKIKAAQNFED